MGRISLSRLLSLQLKSLQRWQLGIWMRTTNSASDFYPVSLIIFPQIAHLAVRVVVTSFPTYCLVQDSIWHLIWSPEQHIGVVAGGFGAVGEPVAPVRVLGVVQCLQARVDVVIVPAVS